MLGTSRVETGQPPSLSTESPHQFLGQPCLRLAALAPWQEGRSTAGGRRSASGSGGHRQIKMSMQSSSRGVLELSRRKETHMAGFSKRAAGSPNLQIVEWFQGAELGARNQKLHSVPSTHPKSGQL